MKNLSILFAAVAALVVIGCSNEAAPAAEGTTSAATTEQPGATTVAMATCAGCGVEKPASELKEDHGKPTCAACIAAHGH